jgi:hypothetical protein
VGVGDFDVNYDDGPRRKLNGQLVFKPMSDPGDSGSIIVKEKDNTVVGLLFAGSKDMTLANPLYKIGWSYIGTLKLDSGAEVPVYDDCNSVVPTRPYEITNSTDSRDVATRANEQYQSSFTEGLYFLGVAQQVEEMYMQNVTKSYWSTPIPPPIRGTSVVTISYSSSVSSMTGPGGPPLSKRLINYLCFG